MLATPRSHLYRSIASRPRTAPETVASESVAWATFAVVEQIGHTASSFASCNLAKQGALIVNYPDEGFVGNHLDVEEQNLIVDCLTFSELEQNSRDLKLNRKKISALKCD